MTDDTRPAARPHPSPFLAVAAAGLGLLLGACGPRTRPVDEAVAARILLVGNGSEPQSLDPHISTGVPESHIQCALFEGLIGFHPTDDFLPEPGVAESWEHEDFTRWTFRLRRDAKWSNGDPVTAGDFVYAFERILQPEFGAEYAEMVYLFMKGAREFHSGETDDFTTVGVRAVDDHTLEIDLVGPVPFFLNVLKHHAWYPVHPPTIEKFGGMGNRLSEWSQAGNLVGNGPFQLDAWRINDVIQVRRNPHYWDAANVGLNGIDFFPIEMETTEDRAYRDGQIHKTNTTPLDKIPVYREEKPGEFHIDDNYATYFYRLNTRRKPLDDVRVRRALALAIDREAIVENITRAGQRPAHGFTPADEHYDPPKVVSFDVEQARALLAEAGFPGGEGFPDMEILINTQEGHRIIAEVVQQMWKQNLGIDVQIRNEEWKVFLDTTQRGDYEIARAGWNADFTDPYTFLSMWVKDGGNNETGWSNERYEALLSESFATSEEEHFAKLREAEGILLDEMPIIPFYWYTRAYLLDPRVKGFHPKLLDQHPWKFVHFDESAGAAE